MVGRQWCSSVTPATPARGRGERNWSPGFGDFCLTMGKHSGHRTARRQSSHHLLQASRQATCPVRSCWKTPLAKIRAIDGGSRREERKEARSRCGYRCLLLLLKGRQCRPDKQCFTTLSKNPSTRIPSNFFVSLCLLFADFVKGSMGRPDVVSMAMSIQNGPALDSLK